MAHKAINLLFELLFINLGEVFVTHQSFVLLEWNHVQVDVLENL